MRNHKNHYTEPTAWINELFPFPDTSDHCPIYCVMKTTGLQLVQEKNPPVVSKPSWKKASQDEKNTFKDLLNRKLQNIVIPASMNSCQNVKCKDEAHCQDSDNFMGNILEAIELSAKETLPSKKNSPSTRKKVTPGWTAEVKPFRDKAFFWSQV